VFGGLVVAVVGAGRFSKVQRVPVPCAAVAINAVAISVFIVCFPLRLESCSNFCMVHVRCYVA